MYRPAPNAHLGATEHSAVSSAYEPIPGVTVVGFVGRSRAGKDTLAQAIVRLRPGAERFGFSDAIAAYARVSGQMTVRDPVVLQRVGWAARQSRPTVWLDALYGAISDRRPPLALITGVRFEDEAEMVRAMGGTLVRVVRQMPDGSEYVSPDRPADHPVERQVDQLECRHAVMINDQNLGMFDRAAEWLLDELSRPEPEATE